MTRKKNLIFHPFLFGLYSILFFYDLNKHEVQFVKILVPTTITIVVVCIFLTFFRIVLGDSKKAGIIVSTLIILFFFYEAILTHMSGAEFGRYILEKDPALFWSYGIFLIFIVFITIFLRIDYFGLTIIFNIVSFILILFPLVSLGIFNNQTQIVNLQQNREIEDGLSDAKILKSKPDIYYIIVDSYTNAENLEYFWGYDNKEFNSYLTKKGFFVVPKGRSNYQHTAYSMPSSLNMQYIDHLIKMKKNGNTLNPERNDIQTQSYLSKMWRENRVSRFLKSLGYTLIITGDWVDGEAADFHFANREILNRFSEYLISKTWLKNLSHETLDPKNKHKQIILQQFKILKKIPEMKQATFTYAHIMIPHPPFIFDKDGNAPKKEDLNFPGKVYPGQVAFTNKKLMEAVDTILLKSKTPPIVIIQGDHGFETATGLKPNENDHRRVFGILNAYYLPKNGKKRLYETITPVNTFRVIFNQHFGTNFKLLPDKSYFRFHFTNTWSFIPIPEHPLSLKDSLALRSANNKWIESLKKYVQNHPDFYDSRVVLGWNYHLLDQASKAIEQYKKAVEIGPALIYAHIDLGIIYYKSKRYREAEKSFEEALKIDPNHERTIVGLGAIYLNTGRIEKARKYLESTIKNAQKNNIPENYIFLGITYNKLNLKQKAIDTFKKTIELFPEYSDRTTAYYYLGKIYLGSQLYKKAIAQFKSLLLIDESYSGANYNIALAFEKINDPISSYRYARIEAAISQENPVLNGKIKILINRLKLSNSQLKANRFLKSMNSIKMGKLHDMGVPLKGELSFLGK